MLDINSLCVILLTLLFLEAVMTRRVPANHHKVVPIKYMTADFRTVDHALGTDEKKSHSGDPADILKGRRDISALNDNVILIILSF